jgi:hypothetical protein
MAPAYVRDTIAQLCWEASPTGVVLGMGRFPGVERSLPGWVLRSKAHALTRDRGGPSFMQGQATPP